VTILVTGANGFLGRAVVDALREHGAEVRALIRSAPPTSWGAEVRAFQADLCGTGDLQPAFDGVECVIHLAADVRGDDQQRLSSMVNGTQRLLQAMERSDCKRLVLAGSFSVYDWSRVGGTLDEQSPTLDHATVGRYDSYAVGKVMQEQLAHWFAARRSWGLTILRPGAIWGRENAYLPDLGLRVGPLHLLVAPPRPLRLTYVENCADAFARAATMTEAVGQVFNVEDGHAVCAAEYLRRIMQRLPLGGVRIPVPYALGHLGARCAATIHRQVLRGRGRMPGLLIPERFEARFKAVECDNSHLRRTLGWSPRYTFQQALDRAFSAPGAAASA
jgi:UDP-glucose 4-epimerase